MPDHATGLTSNAENNQNAAASTFVYREMRMVGRLPGYHRNDHVVSIQRASFADSGASWKLNDGKFRSERITTRYYKKTVVRVNVGNGKVYKRPLHSIKNTGRFLGGTALAGVSALHAGFTKTDNESVDAVTKGGFAIGRFVGRQTVKRPISAVRGSVRMVRKHNYKVRKKAVNRVVRNDRRLDEEIARYNKLQRKIYKLESRKKNNAVTYKSRVGDLKRQGADQLRIRKENAAALERSRAIQERIDRHKAAQTRQGDRIQAKTEKKEELMSRLERLEGKGSKKINLRKVDHKPSRLTVNGSEKNRAGNLAKGLARGAVKGMLSIAGSILAPVFIVIFLIISLDLDFTGSGLSTDKYDGLENLSYEGKVIFCYLYEESSTEIENFSKIAIFCGIYDRQIKGGINENDQNGLSRLEQQLSYFNKTYNEKNVKGVIKNTVDTFVPSGENDSIMYLATKKGCAHYIDYDLNTEHSEYETDPIEIIRTRIITDQLLSSVKMGTGMISVANMSAYDKNFFGWLFYAGDDEKFNSGKNSSGWVYTSLLNIQKTSNNYDDAALYPPGVIPSTNEQMKQWLKEVKVPLRVSGKSADEVTLYVGEKGYIVLFKDGIASLYSVRSLQNEDIQVLDKLPEGTTPADLYARYGSERVTTIYNAEYLGNNQIKIGSLIHMISNHYIINPKTVTLESWRFHRRLYGIFKSVFARIADENHLLGKGGIIESYSWRFMASGKSLSYHRFGTTVDISWSIAMQTGESIWKKYGFFWGHDWPQEGYAFDDVPHFSLINH